MTNYDDEKTMNEMNKNDYTYYNAGEGLQVISDYFRCAMAMNGGVMFSFVLSGFSSKIIGRSLN